MNPMAKIKGHEKITTMPVQRPDWYCDLICVFDLIDWLIVLCLPFMPRNLPFLSFISYLIFLSFFLSYLYSSCSAPKISFITDHYQTKPPYEPNRTETETTLIWFDMTMNMNNVLGGMMKYGVMCNVWWVMGNNDKTQKWHDGWQHQLLSLPYLPSFPSSLHQTTKNHKNRMKIKANSVRLPRYPTVLATRGENRNVKHSSSSKVIDRPQMPFFNAVTIQSYFRPFPFLSFSLVCCPPSPFKTSLSFQTEWTKTSDI